MPARQKKPNLVREYLLTMASLVDGYFTLSRIPAKNIQVHVERAYNRLHGLVSLELKAFPRLAKPWQRVKRNLVPDSERFDKLRIRLRQGESPLRKFLDDYVKAVSAIASPDLSPDEQAKCQALREEVDQMIAKAEVANLERMRQPSSPPKQINQDDYAALQCLIRCFDRPAFYTPFMNAVRKV